MVYSTTVVEHAQRVEEGNRRLAIALHATLHLSLRLAGVNIQRSLVLLHHIGYQPEVVHVGGIFSVEAQQV